MKKKMAALCLIIMLLTGCGAVTSDGTYVNIFNPDKTEEPVEIPAAEIKELTLPYNINDSIFPYAASSEMNRSLIPLIYDPLFKVDETLKAKPYLAQDISANGTEYTVTIRDDVFFTNGKAATAEDVLYSYNQTAVLAKDYWQLQTTVKSIAVLGEKQVVFTTYHADKNFASLLCFPIVQSGDIGAEIIGTGRYKFVSESGAYRLDANTQNPLASKKLDTIELMVLPTDTAVNNALRAGIVDCLYTNLNKPEDYGLGAKSFPVESGNAVYLGFNRTNTVLSDSRVRGLIDKMINKQAMAADIYFNKATATETPFNSSYYDLPDHSLREPLHEEEMRMALESCGLKLDDASGNREKDDKPVKLSILVNADNSIRASAAAQIARNISGYGIEVTVEAVEYSVYLQRLASGKYDMFLAEVLLADNQDISPILSGTSLGISDDAFDSNVLDSYYRYCAEEITCEEFLNVFYSYQPVSVLLYRQGAVMVPKSFMAKMVATNQDIFYNIAEW